MVLTITHALLEYTNAHNNTIKNIKALFLYDFDLNSDILSDTKISSKGKLSYSVAY